MDDEVPAQYTYIWEYLVLPDRIDEFERSTDPREHGASCSEDRPVTSRPNSIATEPDSTVLSRSTLGSHTPPGLTGEPCSRSSSRSSIAAESS